MRRIPALLLAVLGGPGLALAQMAVPQAPASPSGPVTVSPQISGNALTAKIALPGGVEADLSISFEQVVGLHSNALAISAALVDPTDTTILSRMPDPTAISIPAAFPVLLKIDPTASSALSFSGIYRISLHTHNLTLVTNSPLRLFKSHAGGPFKDITFSVDPGSVRTPGGGDGYSEFLIAADVRPIDGVIAGKFDAARNLLASNASVIAPAVLADLQQRLAQARDAYDQGQLVAAINAVAAFSDQVKQQSGASIPDVWRANGDLANVAGALRVAADTLKFSLTWKSNGAR